MNSTWTLLLWQILALIGLLGSIPLLWWSLFGDPQRGERRCPRCWHNLSGTPGLRCGECGFTARMEKDLRRTRRRPGVTATALLVMAVTMSLLYWHVDGRSWMAWIPNRVLIALVPWCESGRDGPLRELQQRMNAGQVTQEQLQILEDRCFSGDRGARPVSMAWRQKYAGLLMTHRQNLKDPEVLDERLLTLPIEFSLTGQATMPERTPVCLNLNIAFSVWPRWSDVKLKISVLDESRRSVIDPLTICRRMRAGNGVPFPIVIPPLDAGEHAVQVEIEVERRKAADSLDWEPVGSYSLQHSVMVKGDPELLPPVRGPEFDADLARAFEEGIMAWEGGVRPRRIRFDVRATSGEAWLNVAIGAEVELLHSGQRARAFRIWWMGHERIAGWEPAEEYYPLLDQLKEESSEWSIRVRGVRDLAYRAHNGRAIGYWDGQVEFPLKVERQPSRASLPLWFYPVEDSVESAQEDF